MRGIAAFMVVLHHAWLATEHGRTVGALQQQLVGAGAAGVDLFFVISGFIMIYVSRNQFGRPGAAGSFLVKRAIRIAPLYWIISAGLLLVWLPGLLLRDDRLSGADVVCSFLFAPCVQPHGDAQTTHPLLDQGWTLSYEWYFYLLFAAWLALGSMRSLVVAAPLFFCAVIAVVMQSSMHGPVALFLSDPVVFEFCFGLLIGLLYLKGVRFPARSAALLIAVGAIALVASGVPERGLRWLEWGVPAAVIIFGMLCVPVPASLPGRALVWLGDTSYSLYLVHGAITMTFDHFLGARRQPIDLAHQWLYVGVMAALAVLAGGLVHRVLERPMTQQLHRWYDRRARLAA